MQHFHTWEAGGKRFKALFDDDYQTERSCGGLRSHTAQCMGNTKLEKYKLHPHVKDSDPWQEAPGSVVCEEFFRQEVGMLDRGEWVALGVVVEEPCRGLKAGIDMVPTAHCECCTSWKETESVWGIVVESSSDAIERFVREGGL